MFHYLVEMDSYILVLFNQIINLTFQAAGTKHANNYPYVTQKNSTTATNAC